MAVPVDKAPSGRSTSELVMDVADDLRLLVRKEFELARIELVDGVKAQLIGAGLITLAAIGTLPALLFFLFAITFALPFSPAVSFAVMGVALLAVAALGIFIGIRIMK